MDKMWLVAREVYRKNIKSWAFFWMIFGPIIMGLVIAAIAFFIYKDQSTSSVGEIGIVSDNSELITAIKAIDNDNYYQFDLSQDQARKELEDKELDGYLVTQESEGRLSAKFYQSNDGKNIATGQFEKILSDINLQATIQRLNLDQSAMQQIQDTQVHLETINLSKDKAGNVEEISKDDPIQFAKLGFAYLTSIIVFMFIMTYVTMVSQEIAAEKGSRIMEIVLSSISPMAHFFGKLLGIFLVILTQIFIYMVLTGLVYYVVGLFLAGQFGQSAVLTNIQTELGAVSGESVDINNLIGPFISSIKPMITYSMLFALLGVFVYLVIAAFLGSLVSRVEDVNKMISPISLIGVAGFYIAMYALNSPNSSIVKISSFIPLFSPFIMPFRIATDTVSTGAIWGAIGTVGIFLILCLWISSVFYKSNTLVYSDKGLIGTLKQSISIWRNEKRVKE